MSEQDELRRMAQEAMKRRIDTTAQRPEQPDPPLRQQQRQQQHAPDARQRREQRQRERQQTAPVDEPEIERIEVLDTTDVPEARRERRERPTDDTRSDIRDPITRSESERPRPSVQQNVHTGIHQDVHTGAYTRSDIRRQRNRIQSDLRDRDAVRRAFIMMEILGKPVSLRGQDGSSSDAG